jgi:hypothetical protein
MRFIGSPSVFLGSAGRVHAANPARNDGHGERL